MITGLFCTPLPMNCLELAWMPPVMEISLPYAEVHSSWQVWLFWKFFFFFSYSILKSLFLNLHFVIVVLIVVAISKFPRLYDKLLYKDTYYNSSRYFLLRESICNVSHFSVDLIQDPSISQSLFYQYFFLKYGFTTEFITPAMAWPTQKKSYAITSHTFDTLLI